MLGSSATCGHNADMKKALTSKRKSRTASLGIAIVVAALGAATLSGCATQPGNEYGGPYIQLHLNDALVAKVTRGMKAAEVEKLLGPPRQRVRFQNLRATAWDYRFIDTFGYIVDFAVMIDDEGFVANTVTARLLADNM
jgi:outer membrane protein assembly factor BamE (lipoprotein component of BamABCDE complex)